MVAAVLFALVATEVGQKKAVAKARTDQRNAKLVKVASIGHAIVAMATVFIVIHIAVVALD
jgi:hypothetical protein